MTAVGKGGVKTPEHLNDTQGRLGDGLGDVTALRRNGTNGGETSLAAVGSKTNDLTRALVELSEAGGEVSGIALLAGHLLQSSRHLAQSLGPAGGGVGDNGDGIAHVAVVFRNGDTRVDGRLARRHGHIRGVGDQHGAVHNGLACAGVGQLRELAKHVGHLVAALAAADVDHKIHVAPLGQLMLNHRLTRAEGAGHAGGTALGDGEERVDHALARDHGLCGRKLFGVGARDADRPLLDEGDLLDGTVGQAQLAHAVGDLKVTGVKLHDGAGFAGRAHDFVEDDVGLLHSTQHVAALYLRAVAQRGFKMPEAVAIQRGLVDAAAQIGAVLVVHGLQRTLNAVVNAAQKAGAKLHRQGRARGYHDVAAAKAGGLLVDLDGGTVAVHFNDLTDQTGVTHPHNVEHIGLPHTLGNDKGA